MKAFVVLFLGALLCGLSSADTVTPLEALAAKRTSWPTAKWDEALVPLAGMKASAACREFTKVVIEEGRDPKEVRRTRALKPEQQPLFTDGIVIVRGGKLVWEWYDDEYDKDSLHCMWSASKSVSSALVGVAVNEGKLKLDEPIGRFFGGTKSKAVVSDLLWMGSGFEWNESYGGDPKKSSITRMLYLDGYHDTADFALKADLVPEGPLGKWIYSSGNTSMLHAILKHVYGNEYEAMPWTHLFDKIGMKKVVVEHDGAGVFIGSSYVHTSPRDMAKLGFLHLNGGIWEGKRLISREAMVMATTLSPAMEAKATPMELIKEEGPYGGGWWLNVDIPKRDYKAPFEKVPKDMFFAAGHYGQTIMLFPSQDLVFVRTGHDREYSSKIPRMAKLALDCFAAGKE